MTSTLAPPIDSTVRKRRGPRLAYAAVLLSYLAGCGADASAPAENATRSDRTMTVGYLEIVTPDVDAACALYEGVHGLSFGPPQEVLGNARTAKKSDGTLVAIRAPLAAHESAIVRAYVAVEDIEAAVKNAETLGAMIAYPPTKQGEYGTFAIVIQDDVQHGLWQP